MVSSGVAAIGFQITGSGRPRGVGGWEGIALPPLASREIHMTTLRQKLLVVEDDAAVASVLGEFLTHDCGWAVMTAEDGRAAIETLTKSPDFDLVLLDLLLPKVSGLHVAAHAIMQDIPVLMTTGNLKAAAAASELGVSILQKPYRFEELRLEVRRTIDAVRQNIEISRAQRLRLARNLQLLRKALYQ